MKRLIHSLGLCVLLVACDSGGGNGGGDNGGGDNGGGECTSEGNKVLINDANAAKVGSATLNALFDTALLSVESDFLFVYFGFEYPDELLAGALSSINPLSKWPKGFSRKQRSADADSSAALNQPLVAIIGGSRDIDCRDGGNYTLQVNDADGNGQLSNGDVYSFTFRSCQVGGLFVNGSFSVVLQLVTNNSPEDEPKLEKFTYDNLRIQIDDPDTGNQADTLNGDMTVDFDSENPGGDISTFKVSGSVLRDVIESSISGKSGTFTLSDYVIQLDGNDVIEEETDSFKGDLDSTWIGGSVSFVTTESNLFKSGYDDDYFYAGEMLITGACDSSVLFTVLDGATVRLSIDANGDGTDETVVDKTWAALASEEGLDIAN